MKSTNEFHDRYKDYIYQYIKTRTTKHYLLYDQLDHFQEDIKQIVLLPKIKDYILHKYTTIDKYTSDEYYVQNHKIEEILKEWMCEYLHLYTCQLEENAIFNLFHDYFLPWLYHTLTASQE